MYLLNRGKSTTNLYVYDGAQVIADLNATGGLVRTYVWGAGIDNLLAMTVHIGATVVTYYPIKDHLGIVHALVNESGAIVERYEFDGFGRLLGAYDGDELPIKESAVGNRYLWQGKEYSWATGLYYFRARWYDPISGRFISKDPSGISNGLNEYMALNNNPVNFVDPTGEAAIEAHEYWMQVAEGGITSAESGGFWNKVGGYSQAAGASIMTSFIDFWGTRTLEKNAGLSGQYSASDECQGKAWLYGGLSVGQIGLEAFGAAKAMDAAKYSLKFAPHGAHHYFKLFGEKLPHLQLNAWIEGVKNSGKVIFRIPWPF